VLNNTLIAITDGLIVSCIGGSIVPDDYLVTARCSTNAAAITVANRNTITLPEAIVINFEVFKGATS